MYTYIHDMIMYDFILCKLCNAQQIMPSAQLPAFGRTQLLTSGGFRPAMSDESLESDMGRFFMLCLPQKKPWENGKIIGKPSENVGLPSGNG